MLTQRVIATAILVPIVVMTVVLASDRLFALISALIFMGAGWEWASLVGLKSTATRSAMPILLGCLFMLIWHLHNITTSLLLPMTGAVWWLLSCFWLHHNSFGAASSRTNCCLKILVGAWVIVPAWGALIQIHHQHGWRWILLFLFTIWTADTAAYFSGRRFGRHKLAPQISPGKTWAGVWGALGAGAMIMGTGAWLLEVRGMTWYGLIMFALLTISASIVGDLLESLIKRQASVKDSGSLIPGHGGLLDRLDSLFAAAPIFALGLRVLLP